jgi:hypothetical protein
MIPRESFDKTMNNLCELCGKNPLSAGVLEWSYEQFEHVDGNSFRQAAKHFAIKGHFPTIGELLKESGYAVPISPRIAQELEQKDISAEAQKARKNERQPHYETMYGELVHIIKVACDTLEQAEKVYQDDLNATVLKHGWKIEKIILDHWYIAEQDEGVGAKIRKKQKVYQRNYLISRIDPKRTDPLYKMEPPKSHAALTEHMREKLGDLF